MKRRLFHVLSAVSLLLCLFTLVMWAISQKDNYGLLVRGCVLISRSNSVTVGIATRQRDRQEWLLAGDIPPGGSVCPMRSLFYVPHPLLALAFAVLPVAWFDQRRRRLLAEQRRGFGLCSRCGYDLRGKPGEMSRMRPGGRTGITLGGK